MNVDEIKQSVSMKELLSQYGIFVNKKDFCCCPFHKEKTASMKVYKDSTYCFGCGRSDDIFSFVMGMDNCDFKSAFKALGGSYKASTDYQRNLHRYRLEKRKQAENTRLQKRQREKQEISEEIKLQKLFASLYPVLSDEWCDAINRLEYLFYRLELLTEKR